MQPTYNSSLVASAGMLGVPVDALDRWVRSFDATPPQSRPEAIVDTLAEQMASEVEKVNPLLAHRWRLLKALRDKGLACEPSR